jgi:hypothetical protein
MSDEPKVCTSSACLAPAPQPGVTHVPLRPKRLRALHVVANAGVGDPVDQLFSELELAAARLSAQPVAP